MLGSQSLGLIVLTVSLVIYNAQNQHPDMATRIFLHYDVDTLGFYSSLNTCVVFPLIRPAPSFEISSQQIVQLPQRY